MSKKINIPSVNIKSELSALFHSFMSHYNKNRSNRRMELYNDIDDYELLWLMQQQGLGYDDYDGVNFYDDDDDDYSVVWPPSHSKKKGKRSANDIYDEFWGGNKKSKRKHRKGKRARLVDINQPYSGEEEEPSEVGFAPYVEVGDDDGILEGKEIYYYPDYHDKDSRLEFSSLKSFNDFCEDNGYVVPDHVANEIMYRRISHTCLRPDAREYGMYEIMAEESYGVMVDEVCDPSELGNL